MSSSATRSVELSSPLLVHLVVVSVSLLSMTRWLEWVGVVGSQHAGCTCSAVPAAWRGRFEVLAKRAYTRKGSIRSLLRASPYPSCLGLRSSPPSPITASRSLAEKITPIRYSLYPLINPSTIHVAFSIVPLFTFLIPPPCAAAFHHHQSDAFPIPIFSPHVLSFLSCFLVPLTPN